MSLDFSNSWFYLKKWYMDAADEEGRVYIGYWGFLRWHKIHLHYFQHLWRSPETGVQSEGHFSYQPEPTWQNGKSIVWQPDNQCFHWYSLADGIDTILLKNENGAIHWRCCQPKAFATIQMPSFSMSGLGYTECIEMSIPFWKLPINTLFWGRSHSENHYIVWIKWDGSTQYDSVWHNGDHSEVLNITPTQICGTDFELTLRNNIPLREGQLGSTVFRPFRSITQKFPEKILNVYEQKWFNQGRLHSRDTSEKAMSIYEKVCW